MEVIIPKEWEFCEDKNPRKSGNKQLEEIQFKI